MNVNSLKRGRGALAGQVFRFMGVGLFTFGVDYGLMVVGVEILGVNYLASAALGFLGGSLLNYGLSRRFVFEPGKHGKISVEFFIFMGFTISGLALNHMIMFMGCTLLLLDYRWVKIISLCLVTGFNFAVKKIYVFEN